MQNAGKMSWLLFYPSKVISILNIINIKTFVIFNKKQAAFSTSSAVTD
jgi:hypothetical protein